MEENKDRESKSSRETDEAEYKVRQSPARNNKQSCFYNYSPGSKPGVKSMQVHAVPVSGGVIDRSKNKRVVRGMFRAAPQRQQPWPSPDGQPTGKCDANASGSAAGGSWQFPNFPKHTSQGSQLDQWARAKAKRWDGSWDQGTALRPGLGWRRRCELLCRGICDGFSPG
jgi:hypothetical protein